jgi:hypothetical protein
MSGKITIIFDGMERMIANGSINTTAHGITTHSTSLVDYRWKSPMCSPNDVNMRQRGIQ